MKRWSYWLGSVCALGALTLAAEPALAFPPSGGLEFLAGADYSHKDITERAILRVIRDVYGVNGQQSSVQDAIKEIAQHNADVDDRWPELTRAHFDGENFEGGHSWLRDNRQSIVRNFQQQGRMDWARAYLGWLLHPLQDFYTHSNWWELGYRVLNTLLD